MDTTGLAVSKPSTAAVLPKSPKKSSDSSDSGLYACGQSTQPSTSPVTSLALSTSMEQEDPGDTYILLDECFSGPASISSKMSSSLAGSPDNVLADHRNVQDNYVNLYISGCTPISGYLPTTQEPVHSPHSGLHATTYVDGVFEGTVQPESGSSMDLDVPDGYFTNGGTDLENLTQSETNELPPSLPAKMSVPSDVEYDVPFLSSASASTSSRAPAPVLDSPVVPPPRAHMAVPGRMHRYVNTAPVVVPRNHAESSPAVSVGGNIRPTQQNTTPSLPLPPKAHG